MRARRVLASLAALLFAAAAASARERGGSSAGSDCGGDAYSRGGVVEHRPARRGPLETVPDTLCADLAPQHAPPSVEIDAYVGGSPQVGSGGARIPYEDGSRRGVPPRFPRP